MKKKEDVYLVVDTPKKAKKLQEVLDIFKEPIFSEESIENCIDSDLVMHNDGEEWLNVNVFEPEIKGKQKASIKELRNILAVEHLKEGDVVVCGIGSTEYVVEYKKFYGNYFESIDYYMIGGSGKTRGVGAFNDFIRYATDEERLLLEPKEEKKELEVGKWYIVDKDSEVWAGRATVNGILCYKGDSVSFGFNMNGEWWDNFKFNESYPILREATAEEVKQALIKEAKHRGLVEGSVCNNSNIHGVNVGNNLIDDFGGYEFNVEKNELRVLYKNDVDTWYTIFKDGKWAEVLPQPETQQQITDQDIATLERLHDTLHDVHGYSLEFELMKSARVLADKLRELNTQKK